MDEYQDIKSKGIKLQTKQQSENIDENNIKNKNIIKPTIQTISMIKTS